MPTLKRITIFPIKSLDGFEISTVSILPSGALAGDRRYALVDSEGKFVNGKRYASIHRIRAKYDDHLEHVTLSTLASAATFSLQRERDEIAAWCSSILEVNCQLVENPDNGHPDDLDAAGPTLISTSTLAEISTWFDEFDLEEARRRFRTNLEIEAESPFWEDQLVGDPGRVNRFCIGETSWTGCGICQRCAVPSRNPQGGIAINGFAREFSRLRQQSLPTWSPAERFDHFYRVAINTSLESLEDGHIIQVGDAVELREEGQLEL